MFNMAVMVSGSGSNLQAIIDKVACGFIRDARVALVISDNERAYALERARQQEIPSCFIQRGKQDVLLEVLESYKVDFIVLAGYLSILEAAVIQRYKNRIINIHPSLIPKYAGKGFYGIRVHEKVLAAGEKESGATVHYVDEGIDTGAIILQRKVLVDSGDTAEALQQKVLNLEHEILPEAINILVNEIEHTAQANQMEHPENEQRQNGWKKLEETNESNH